MKSSQKLIEKTLKNLMSEDQDAVIRSLFKHLSWPSEVNSRTEYFINEDDSDGERRGLGVSFLNNGDGVIDLSCCIESQYSEGDTCSDPHIYRFRTQTGGGRKILIHKALLLLALAVTMDPDEIILKDST